MLSKKCPEKDTTFWRKTFSGREISFLVLIYYCVVLGACRFFLFPIRLWSLGTKTATFVLGQQEIHFPLFFLLPIPPPLPSAPSLKSPVLKHIPLKNGGNMVKMDFFWVPPSPPAAGALDMIALELSQNSLLWRRKTHSTRCRRKNRFLYTQGGFHKTRIFLKNSFSYIWPMLTLVWQQSKTTWYASNSHMRKGVKK